MNKKSVTFISLLRGINVSGKNLIKMSDLKNLFESLGFQNVCTYVQSGNVVFQSNDQSSNLLGQKIELAIKARFGFAVNVLVRNAGELKEIVEKNPLFNNPEINPEYFHITLLSARPDPEKVRSAIFLKDDKELYFFKDREIFLYCPNGYGRTKLTNNTFEKKLGVAATTRNWKTLNALLDIIKEL